MLTILKNPAYQGDYVYRRKIVDRALGRDQAGRPRLRAAKPDEMVLISNHHEPYVTREDWQEIQAIMRVMGNTYHRTNLGPGSGLLQGVVRCALHNDCRMQVAYRRRQVGGPTLHYYSCLGDSPYGGRLCGGVPGRPVDREIVLALLDRIAPPRVQAIMTAWHAAQEHRLGADGLAVAQLKRARRRADELERRYMLVDPANRLVAASIESDLEDAKRELLALEANSRVTAERSVDLSRDDLAELENLSKDVAGVFYAPTTTDRDRKEIIRTLVQHVSYEGKSPEWISVRIRWADGGPDTSLRVRNADHGRLRIRQLAQSGLSASQIYALSKQEMLTTRTSRPWTRKAIGHLVNTINKSNTPEKTLPIRSALP